MPLTIVNVAYPLAPVGPDAAGGAEQVLFRLDEALVRSGHSSRVIACEGSMTCGTLLPTPGYPGTIGDDTRAAAWAACQERIQEALARWAVDVVHLHGIDFYQYLPPPGTPVLVTLHLPPEWYPSWIFTAQRPGTFLHCVSSSQERRCPPCDILLPPVENGVSVEFGQTRHAKRRYVLCLGRICPEKGFHLALEAARLARVPLLLAGEVFKYGAHEAYFREQIAPALAGEHRYIGPVRFRRKRRLLSAARCLLVPSLAPETSSLVAMEALACGTPVIAFSVGALPEIVEHGKTGYIVCNQQEMAEAIRVIDCISGEACRASAQQRFSAERMVTKYLELYQWLAESRGANGGRKGVDGYLPAGITPQCGGDYHVQGTGSAPDGLG